MSNTRKILYGVAGVYVAGIVLLVVIFGFGHKNNAFQIQNEFKLINWVHLGVFSINRAVLYLFIAAILTIVTMVWIARRMQARPNKVQTAVETLYSLMRDNITRGNMDDSMAAKWFPFIGALFLFIWFCNLIGYLPLPTNSEEKFNIFGAAHPVVRAVRGDGQHLGAAGARARRVRRLQLGGHPRPGPDRLRQEPDPAGVHGPILFLIAPLEVISTFMRLISLTIRLFANILAGHMIILFMAGGLAVILGLTLPRAGSRCRSGSSLYLFELGLVATLQAFIFATLAAIYIGGAVSHH